MTVRDLDAWYADLGRRMKGMRRAAGLRQQDVADATGVSRMTIANVEAGRQRPPLHRLLRVAALTGCQVTDLLPSWDPPAGAEDEDEPATVRLTHSQWVDDVLANNADEIQRMRAGRR